MLFSSNTFLFFFLPITVLTYYLCPRRWRNAQLLLASLVFYGWGEPRFLPLMLIVILLNYFCGIAAAACIEKGMHSGPILWLDIVLNLGILCFFKYGRFFFGDRFPEVALPLGISFYIFQAMGYTIDVVRKEVPAQRNLLIFGTYVTLFPQLVAGPIVRYRDVAGQLKSRRENTEQFAYGLQRFVLGLSKKVLLANTFGGAWNALRDGAGFISGWLGLMCYTLQIYFDFSGYSDMAIGLGSLFGFSFLENFQYPYSSQSVTEFWRRWHISLSSWFKEYVYIPLGGNRRGKARQILNILIVWLLTGLWHGASWNFVLWGGYYAVLLIVEKLWLLNWSKRWPKGLRHIGTMLAVMVGWAIFYFEDMYQLTGFLMRLLSPKVSGEGLFYLPMLLLGGFCALPAAGGLFKKMPDGAKWAACLLLFVLCVASLASKSYNPFIYFRF